MTEKPILFNGEMVRAILDGRKTQTRRPIKPQPPAIDGACWAQGEGLFMLPGSRLGVFRASPYIEGDWLWVRETFYVQGWLGLPLGERQPIHYAADIMYRDEVEDYTCKPSIHMPRWASRITLEVTGVRVERVQDITQQEASAEGASFWWNAADGKREVPHGLEYRGDNVPEDKRDYLRGFRILWNGIYAKRGMGWDANPWVWAYTFKRITP